MDLIAGLAGQTFASWEESLAALAGSGVPHASVYMLEVDEDSRLGREMLADGARYHAGLVPGDDAIARMYERAIERLQRPACSSTRSRTSAVPASIPAQSSLLAAASLSWRGTGCLFHAARGDQPRQQRRPCFKCRRISAGHCPR